MLVPLYQLMVLPHLQYPRQGHISESSKKIAKRTQTLKRSLTELTFKTWGTVTWQRYQLKETQTKNDKGKNIHCPRLKTWKKIALAGHHSQQLFPLGAGTKLQEEAQGANTKSAALKAMIRGQLVGLQLHWQYQHDRLYKGREQIIWPPRTALQRKTLSGMKSEMMNAWVPRGELNQSVALETCLFLPIL